MSMKLYVNVWVWNDDTFLMIMILKRQAYVYSFIAVQSMYVIRNRAKTQVFRCIQIMDKMVFVFLSSIELHVEKHIDRISFG